MDGSAPPQHAAEAAPPSSPDLAPAPAGQASQPQPAAASTADVQTAAVQQLAPDSTVQPQHEEGDRMMAAEAQASQQQQQQQQQAELVLGKAAADASTAPGAAVSVVSAQAGGPPGMQGAPGPHGAAGAAEPSRKRSHADMAAVGEQSGDALLLLERMLQEDVAAQDTDGDTWEVEVPSLRSSHLQLYYKPPPSMLQPLSVGTAVPAGSTEEGSAVHRQQAAPGTGSVQGGPHSKDCTWAPPRHWSSQVAAQAKAESAGQVVWPLLLQQPGVGHVSQMTAQRVLTHKLDRSTDAAAVAVLGRLFGQQAASLCCDPSL